MLSKRHLEDVCLVNENDHTKCKYLAQDDLDWSKYYCLKKSKNKASIDAIIDEHMEDCVKNGKDPTADNEALGDNCDGYLVMKHVMQGYDVS